MGRHPPVYFAGVDGQPILLIIMRDWRKATDFQTTVRKMTRPNLTPIMVFLFLARVFVDELLKRIGELKCIRERQVGENGQRQQGIFWSLVPKFGQTQGAVTQNGSLRFAKRFGGQVGQETTK